MKKLVLDIGILSGFLSRRVGIFDRLQNQALNGARIGTCTPVLGELISGIQSKASRDRNMQILHNNLRSITIWSFDEAAAFNYGRIYSELRSTGRPMQLIDIMLAAVAMTLPNATVITTDSDLLDIPDLRVEIW